MATLRLLPIDLDANYRMYPKKKGNNRILKWLVVMFIVLIIVTGIGIALRLLMPEDSSTISSSTNASASSALSGPGMIGLWPTFGGGLLNQQIAPNSLNIKFNNHNIKDISIKCIYESEEGIGFTGYPAIDNKNNSYFTDLNGYITSINLDSCHLNWKQHIGVLLGYDENIHISTMQSLTIFQDSDNNKGILFGAPGTYRWRQSNFNPNDGCYAVAIHLNNGSFWWKVTLGEKNNKHNYHCCSHGFYIDGKYAFGGMSQGGNYNLQDDAKYIGRYFKIDIDQHEIVNVWYPFDYDLTNDLDEFGMSYNGISIYNYPAIIDDYVIFGTANIMTVPYKIAQCLTETNSNNFDEYLALNESNYIDMCGNDKSDNVYYRCFVKDIYPTSLIILNKHTFKLEVGIPLQGLDIVYPGCSTRANNEYCAGWYLPNRPGIIGFNSDLTAVAVYRNKINNKLYVVASQKPARLHIFEVPSGKLHLTRKYGPQTQTAQFGIAVDEESMIGITSINGDNTASYKLSDDMKVCDGTGSIHAFDLNTGNTLWILINPYGKINDPICFNGNNNYIDYTIQLDTTCNYGNFTDNNNNIPIHILPKSTYLPFESDRRAQFYGPVTIVKDMVIIPSETGDIWIVNLYDGQFLHHIECINKPYLNNIHNRAGIKGGISVVNDRIVFYCGSYHQPYSYGNTLMSIQL